MTDHAPPASSRAEHELRGDRIDQATGWGLVCLAALAALGAVVRVVGTGAQLLADRIDQTTLLYVAAAAVLLGFRRVRNLSWGGLRLELIERLRERQALQEDRLDDIQLILPLLLPEQLLTHLRNLEAGHVASYRGNPGLRDDLRRLRSMGLIASREHRPIGEIKDGQVFDLSGFVRLTDLGRQWVRRMSARSEPALAADARESGQ